MKVKNKSISKIFSFILLSFLLFLLIFTFQYRSSIVNASSDEIKNEKEEEKVYPSGVPVGIYIKTKGLLVLGTENIETDHGQVPSPCKHRIQSGDYLLKYNDITLESKKQLLQLLEQNKGEEIIFTILRDDEKMKTKITPVYAASSKSWQIGLWVRNDTQGIGTITFVRSNGDFMALGHNITDIDIGVPLATEGGSIYATDIYAIHKGENGSPGALIGSIDYLTEHCIGVIQKNVSAGIVGNIRYHLSDYMTQEPLSIAKNEEVTTGDAMLRTSISGTVKDYTVKIEKIRSRKKNTDKSFVLKITDKELLNMTGGIIQGLSGSPIIQNGKLIGAVTHVFVHDSSKGYGIMIENMIKEE